MGKRTTKGKGCRGMTSSGSLSQGKDMRIKKHTERARKPLPLSFASPLLSVAAPHLVLSSASPPLGPSLGVVVLTLCGRRITAHQACRRSQGQALITVIHEAHVVVTRVRSLRTYTCIIPVHPPHLYAQERDKRCSPVTPPRGPLRRTQKLRQPSARTMVAISCIRKMVNTYVGLCRSDRHHRFFR